jgi:alanyl-tRNA synthetase
MKTNQIRDRFLSYFGRLGHTIVPSSPLVPGNDPSLLFTNAGMVQFKEVFLGVETRDYERAASSQRCVRAGGKHNDLERVGYTARHHTFFEMLGNFSFGDYFKREAIAWAWELLTREFGLPPEKLWVTVHEKDDAAADIWLKEVGVDARRFSRCGDDDNFWMMGNTGPCGPCSEIFYDHGVHVPGGPPGSPDADGDRYVEIWNLVFMQYNRDEAGTLTAIPRQAVDTGMGLERIAAVLQGVHSNYEIDLFRHLIARVHELAGRDDLNRQSVQVLADHIRSSAFLIADGVVPSNEGRGYVLRRIIRRALRHGHKLGFTEPFFHKMVGALEAEMGKAHPALAIGRAHIESTLAAEEERFAETLDQGMRLLEGTLTDLPDGVIPGHVAFKLYDTYGFPVDLTADVARERGVSVDMAGFEAAMAEQRSRARSASQFADLDTSHSLAAAELERFRGKVRFTGYEGVSHEAHVLALYRDGRGVGALTPGEKGMVVLDATPFYAEAGGQVGDRGRIGNARAVFEVLDTQQQGEVHVHIGRMKLGQLEAGDAVTAAVESQHREPTRLNHSATHLLHAALRKVLGTHVTQKGSLVAPDRLRFDFSHSKPLTPEELLRIESLVNEEIRRNTGVVAEVLPYQRAIDSGALALFGEKYGAEVRVLRMGDFSVELCGGTHVTRTGDIGLFRIVSEGGVAAGVRRIEAQTGAAALQSVQESDRLLRRLAERLKTGVKDLETKIEQLLERARSQERELDKLKGKLAGGAGRDLSEDAIEVRGVRVVASRIDGADAKSLREAVDRVKQRLRRGAVVLAAVEDGKVRLVAGVTQDLTAQVRAGDLANFVAKQVGGRGGGRADMAQAGGSDPTHLNEALAAVPQWIERQLG